MSLNMKNCCNSTNVVTSCYVGKVSWFVLYPINNWIFLKIVFKSISFIDLGMGISDCSAIMGNDVGNFVGSNSLALDLQQLGLWFIFFNFNEVESSLDVIEKSIMLISLDNGENVHDTDWEFVISSHFIIDFNSWFFVLGDDSNFATCECNFEVISKWMCKYLRRMERGRHSLSLWGPWLGLVALIPPILERSQDLGVLILLRCFLGPLAIEYLSKNILLIKSFNTKMNKPWNTSYPIK